MENMNTMKKENPAADRWANMEPERLYVDLKSPEFTGKFQSEGEIWQQSKTVNAVHVTEEGLEAGDYNNLGVRYGEHTFKDKDGNEEQYTGWLIDTYVMKGEGEERQSQYETTRRLTPGEWIVTNPRCPTKNFKKSITRPTRMASINHQGN